MKKILIGLPFLFVAGCDGFSVSKEVSTPTTPSCDPGYVYVAANSTLGTSQFCVMKYEAKNDGSNNPISTDITTPWASITPDDAKQACLSIGDDYNLISNAEWMAIAHEIESNVANHISLGGGDYCISRGNTSAGPGDCTYSHGGVDFGASRDPLASHLLASGETIFDISGNLSEWVDWEPTQLTFGTRAFNTCTDSGQTLSFTNFRCPEVMALNEYMPLTGEGDLNSTHIAAGLGQMAHSGMTVPARGGRYNTWSATSGIYGMEFSYGLGSSNNFTGFRCVQRL